MKKFFDTCDIIDYCSPPSPVSPQIESEWILADNINANKSWRDWLRGSSNAVSTILSINPNHITQQMKRDS